MQAFVSISGRDEDPGVDQLHDGSDALGEELGGQLGAFGVDVERLGPTRCTAPDERFQRVLAGQLGGEVGDDDVDAHASPLGFGGEAAHDILGELDGHTHDPKS